MRCINVKECQLCVNFHSSLATHKLCELKWSRRQKRAIDKCVLTNTTAHRIYTTNTHRIDEVFFLRNWNISYLLAVSVGNCVCDRPPRIQFNSIAQYPTWLCPLNWVVAIPTALIFLSSSCSDIITANCQMQPGSYSYLLHRHIYLRFTRIDSHTLATKIKWQQKLYCYYYQ